MRRCSLCSSPFMLMMPAVNRRWAELRGPRIAKKRDSKRIAVGKNELVELRSEDEHEAMRIFFEDGQIAVLLAKAEHAGHRVFDEIEEPALRHGRNAF